MDRRRWLRSIWFALASWPLASTAALRKPWRRQDKTPALQLPSVDGELWTLASEKGHPVLLNFWASWCEPCRSEMPSLERLAQVHADAGLKVIAVNFKEGDAAVRRFLAGTPLKLPVVRDTDGAAARAFGISIFPSTVVIDRTGRTLFICVGELDWTDAEGQAMVRPLL